MVLFAEYEHDAERADGQGGAAEVHEPGAARGHGAGHVHLDRWVRGGTPRQDAHPLLRTPQTRR